ISGVTKNRDGKREASLHLENCGCTPVLRHKLREVIARPCGNVIHGAESKATPNIACRAFFRVEVIVILRNSCFKHRRAEVRRVSKAFSKRVIGKKTQTTRITAAH